MFCKWQNQLFQGIGNCRWRYILHLQDVDSWAGLPTRYLAARFLEGVCDASASLFDCVFEPVTHCIEVECLQSGAFVGESKKPLASGKPGLESCSLNQTKSPAGDAVTLCCTFCFYLLALDVQYVVHTCRSIWTKWTCMYPLHSTGHLKNTPHSTPRLFLSYYMSKWQSGEEGDSALTQLIAPFGTIIIIIIQLIFDTLAREVEREQHECVCLRENEMEFSVQIVHV